MRNDKMGAEKATKTTPGSPSKAWEAGSDEALG